MRQQFSDERAGMSGACQRLALCRRSLSRSVQTIEEPNDTPGLRENRA
jgi:hypothetical protein